MTDWATISSLATAAGTLVLAVATYASVRSAQRASRVAERALQVQLRPLLVPTRFEDPAEKVGFIDNRWLRVEGGRAGVEVSAEVIYLVLPLRNVGSGLAVLDRWDVYADMELGRPDHGAVDHYRRLSRDLYVAPGDHGFWQGALRDPTDPAFVAVRNAIEERRSLFIELLYGDHDGGQRTITRFGVLPYGEGGWLATSSRYWYLDQPNPR